MDIVKTVSREKGISLKESGKIIHGMAHDGSLEYVNELGHIFVVPSFNRPVRLSGRVVVHPPGIAYHPQKTDDISVTLSKTTSFGRGDHPTTRLSLKAMEKGFGLRALEGHDCLDMGCGSGILAIASVLMGMKQALAVDIDPLAVHDARCNVSLNRLEDRVEVSENMPESGCFHLICANLRPPTLARYKKDFASMSAKEGVLVLSGFKEEEVDSVKTRYASCFSVQETFHENGWSALLLIPNTQYPIPNTFHIKS
ncbi:MAG: 50S ribosomal protein L11 methyltransferase [Desulfarculaceae bacterium]|nr:50S ribosomal protein L11 methyltransferase [Desulfarculaceae bacterium]